jgi:hypothetical protein
MAPRFLESFHNPYAPETVPHTGYFAGFLQRSDNSEIIP